MSDEMVMCADGEERDAAECVQATDGEWYPEDECVTDYRGRQVYAEAALVLANGEYACPDDEDVVCRADGESDLSENCRLVDNEWYPEDEVTSCDWCDSDHLNDDSIRTDSGDYICRHCYEDYAYTCDGCGEVFHTDDITSTDSGCYCDGCKPSSLISNYSDKSANYLRPESTDKLLFGIELEVETRGDDADSGAEFVRQSLPDSYCTLKEDGSLGDSGFEIVTRPDSVDVHKRWWGSFFSELPHRKLSSWDNGRCGMHIHVTKSAMSQLQLGKLMCFLNEPANTGFVVSVAGRDGEQWARRCKKKITDIHNEDEGRYVALNITGRTAEVRIFRGTLKPESFYKNLEFVAALVEFCQPAGRSMKEALSYVAFCEWLDRKSYPFLWNYLKGRGFVKGG